MRKLVALKHEMIKQSVSSLKISQELNISPSLFSMYTNGWRKMPDSLKKEIAQYFNLSPYQLFEDYYE